MNRLDMLFTDMGKSPLSSQNTARCRSLLVPRASLTYQFIN